MAAGCQPGSWVMAKFLRFTQIGALRNNFYHGDFPVNSRICTKPEYNIYSNFVHNINIAYWNGMSWVITLYLHPQIYSKILQNSIGPILLNKKKFFRTAFINWFDLLNRYSKIIKFLNLWFVYLHLQSYHSLLRNF